MTGPDLTLRAISPDLADILDAATRHDADPAGIKAFTEDWLINELMRDDPTLSREAAIAQIRRGFDAAAEGRQNDEIVLSGEGLRATPPEGASAAIEGGL